MAVHDFISEADVANAPEDPAMAFAELVGVADKRLSDQIAALDSSDQDSGYAYTDARYGFMNVVIGLAKAYQIEPFASHGLPRRRQFDHDDYEQFKADLDHYLTQLLVNNTIRNRRYSVALTLSSKEKIRDYVRALRDQIDAGNFTDAKREELHKKLSDFETALDKSRLSLLEVTMLALAILGLPGALGASYDVVAKLTQNILEIVAEAKVVDEENRRLAPVEEPAALLPPRPAERQERKPGGSLADELDDEIPF